MEGAISRRERLLLWSLFLGSSFVYGLYAVAKHLRFMTSTDVALFDQHLWRAAHGEPLANTVRGLPHLWGDHLHPLFLILTPVEWLGHADVHLLWIQAAFVCAAAFPLYRYARRRIDPTPALLLVAGFLVAWPIGEGLGFDVHDIALAVPALAWAILSFEERRWTPFAIAVVAMLLSREDQGLTVAMFGVLALARRDWGRGVALGSIGLGWTLAATKWIIPHFAGSPYPQWLYGHLAPDAPTLVVVLLTHPKLLVQSLLVPWTKAALVRRFLEPGLFLGLASPLAILAIPGVLARLLSGFEIHWLPVQHWGMPTATILAFATVDAFGRALPLVRRIHRAKVARWGAGVLLVASLLGAALVPQKSMVLPSFWRDDAERVAGREALALIPSSASVVATNRAVAHLGARQEVYVDSGFYRTNPQTWSAPGRPSRAAEIAAYRRGEYVLFDPWAEDREGLSLMERLPEYERIFEREGWTVFRRRASAERTLVSP